MDKAKARIAIYALAGVYLLVIAYQMFQGLDSVVDTNERILSIIFIVVFIIIGGVLVGIGIWVGNKGMKAYKEAYYADPKELHMDLVQESDEEVEISENVTKIDDSKEKDI